MFIICVNREVELGQLNIIDRLLDGIMYSVWLLFLLDFLEVQTGMAVKVCVCSLLKKNEFNTPIYDDVFDDTFFHV